MEEDKPIAITSEVWLDSRVKGSIIPYAFLNYSSPDYETSEVLLEVPNF